VRSVTGRAWQHVMQVLTESQEMGSLTALKQAPVLIQVRAVFLVWMDRGEVPEAAAALLPAVCLA
jgi:hypothetical protein